MSDYASNTPISAPLELSATSVDVDLNGLKFNYDIGLFFTPTSTLQPLRLPPPLQDLP